MEFIGAFYQCFHINRSFALYVGDMVVVDTVEVRRNVEIGGVRSIPVKAVIGLMLLRWDDGELLSTACTTGRRSGHSEKSIRNSNRVARSTRRSSFPNLSTAPLLQGVYGRVKCWGTFRPFDTLRTVSFLK